MGDSRTSFGGQAPSSSSMINENVEDLLPILNRIDSILTDLPLSLEGVTNTESRSSLPSSRSYSRISLPRLTRLPAGRSRITNGEVERIYRYCDDINVTLRRLERETNVLAGSSSNISNNERSLYNESFPRPSFDLSENNSNTNAGVFFTSPFITNNRTVSLRSPTSPFFRRTRYDQYLSRTVRFRSRSPHSSSVGTSTNNIDSIPDTRDVVIENKSVKNKDVTIICPVCMDNCINKKPTTTKCGHMFCQLCIRKALLLTGKCPCCNLKQTTKKLIRVYL